MACNPLNSSPSRQIRGNQTAPDPLHRRKAARHRHGNPNPQSRPPRSVCMRLGMADFIALTTVPSARSYSPVCCSAAGGERGCFEDAADMTWNLLRALIDSENHRCVSGTAHRYLHDPRRRRPDEEQMRVHKTFRCGFSRDRIGVEMMVALTDEMEVRLDEDGRMWDLGRYVESQRQRKGRLSVERRISSSLATLQGVWLAVARSALATAAARGNAWSRLVEDGYNV